jgi:hypothetical protein
MVEWRRGFLIRTGAKSALSHAEGVESLETGLADQVILILRIEFREWRVETAFLVYIFSLYTHVVVVRAHSVPLNQVVLVTYFTQKSQVWGLSRSRLLTIIGL